MVYRQNGKVSPECAHASVYRSVLAIAPYGQIPQQAASWDLTCAMRTGLDVQEQAPYSGP